MVNHLQSTHYHLGLICAHCLDYFTTNADTMHHHIRVYKSMTASGDDDDDRDKEDYEDNDNGDEDDEFMFKGD